MSPRVSKRLLDSLNLFPMDGDGSDTLSVHSACLEEWEPQLHPQSHAVQRAHAVSRRDPQLMAMEVPRRFKQSPGNSSQQAARAHQPHPQHPPLLYAACPLSVDLNQTCTHW
eukprot:CAMPEP_0174368764 /NCGR_PEP_ID=MMETSP0811_2-20130205/90085_1 /TAXON_ID=73025 ORGANISM="Eutreptiella gymnastica-like, Strain CCMP1594" /NCGR_SAMPLE_ID=MMETSP0811_2 /ASSEMBLY_ACC=CAM_ASM_000667 /LENGTH=111 /DNA_ID=CAMNT_0015512525 /DNA_START=683 /DNA_END=1015 /DNA_ORIENTATION=-